MNMENTVGQKKYDLAVFAGGCFWCLVAPFQQLEGVVKVESGYTGGSTENPTYEEVCSGETGHREAVRITYDPEIISFSRLLDTYWRQTDPTDPGGQFADPEDPHTKQPSIITMNPKKRSRGFKKRTGKQQTLQQAHRDPNIAGSTFLPCGRVPSGLS